MPPKATTLTPRQKRINKTELANKLAEAALNGDSDSSQQESDEEIGHWERIYETKKSNNSDDEAVSSKKRRGKQAKSTTKEPDIIGARRTDDGLECRVGDCVLLKAADGSVPWVGMIMQFTGADEDGDDCANFLWFCNEKEIQHKAKKRGDFLPVISLQKTLKWHANKYRMRGWDESPLDSIIEKATILTESEFAIKFPKGTIPRKSAYFGKVFVCRRGCNLKSTTYSEEFSWNDISHDTEDDVIRLMERLKSETKATKKSRLDKRKRGDDEFDLKDEADDEPGTPRKKHKTFAVSTPRKPRTPSKLLTPSHKRVIVKKPLEFTPLGTRVLDSDHVYSSPFQTARSRLHVSSVPTSLPCREDEFASVYSHLEAAIYEGTGACIYISGTPGTGKTATVREVVAQLNAASEAEELDYFTFVEINGMKVTDPHQSYSLLWEALKGDRVSPSHALDLLEREFNHPSPRRTPCVVLMDELDQLVTKNQSVMYNFFNWPGLRHSKLIVLAVANTMDLPERTLSNKISSRLGLTRITFAGYTHEQLMKIIQSRLEGVPGDIVTSDAIQFASRKVAAVSGDARRALDICRRAVELAESETLSIPAPNTPSKSGKGLEKMSKSLGIVTIATVKKAINEATTSPLQQYLRGLPLSAKILLAALMAKTRRTGVAESVLGDVLDEARRMAKMDTGGKTLEYLMKPDSIVSTKGMVLKQPMKAPRVLAMGMSAVDLMEAGIIGLEARKADRTGKIRLSIGDEDLKLAFKDDPEIKSLGFTA
ncbi:Origin recognition complex subunit 1 [Lachnellula cervina]|uniref:Origin recognition complex subunit 1 n=1 Tax=Lachnellula cervina TaxID=1316786 RepID=A0A7D8UN85_9HELO|nr:Origin recognition complex subunit 1 [Lachnellula cervina]